jgi:hypothetical protein
MHRMQSHATELLRPLLPDLVPDLVHEVFATGTRREHDDNNKRRNRMGAASPGMAQPWLATPLLPMRARWSQR